MRHPLVSDRFLGFAVRVFTLAPVSPPISVDELDVRSLQRGVDCRDGGGLEALIATGPRMTCRGRNSLMTVRKVQASVARCLRTPP